MPLCGWLIAPQVSARAMQFVRQKSGRPYFVAMNFIDAHDPYYVPPGCRDRSFHAVPRRDQQKLLDASPGRRLDPLMVARTHGQYRMAMRCMDRTLGSLLRALDDGNTVIAVVGDHGEQFGEHGWGGHGNTLYRQLLHVPLILKIPGRVPARVNDPVSTADLFATLIRASQAGRMRAPIPLLDAGWRRPVIANFDMRRHRSLEGGFSIVRGDLHFTRSTSGRENLFDYRADPLEDLPLSPSTHRPIIDPMRARLLHAAGQQRRRVEFDALGYLN